MIDITSISNDLNVMDSQVPKSANVLQVQLGDLEYNKTFGIDLKFFLDPEFQFQNESFKAYLIQRLSEHNVNVSMVTESINNLFLSLTFEIGGAESSGGLIR